MAPTDCGVTCPNAATSNYYSCPAGKTARPLQWRSPSQVANPATKCAVDNNGVIVQLPPVATAAASVTGTLVFGIGTQGNNALTGATLFSSTGFGELTGTYKGAAATTIVDSGWDGLFFTDSLLPACASSFYCPTNPQALSATISGLSGTTGTVNVTVNNAQTLAASGTDYALNGLAASIGSFPTLFDFGLPFFFGRYVYFGFAITANSPYMAF